MVSKKGKKGKTSYISSGNQHQSLGKRNFFWPSLNHSHLETGPKKDEQPSTCPNIYHGIVAAEDRLWTFRISSCCVNSVLTRGHFFPSKKFQVSLDWLGRITGNQRFSHEIWGFPKSWGYPNLWLVFVRENPIEMDDLRVSPILGNPHMDRSSKISLQPIRWEFGQRGFQCAISPWNTLKRCSHRKRLLGTGGERPPS